MGCARDRARAVRWCLLGEVVLLELFLGGSVALADPCTLMHELGHAHYGHVGVTGKQEVLANRWAAHRLIHFEDLLAADRLEHASAAVASNLGVLPSVLETYLKMLTRTEMDALRSAALRRVA